MTTVVERISHDISDEQKSMLAKLPKHEQLKWIRTRINEHRETIRSLERRFQTIEAEHTAILYLLSILRESNANLEKDK